MKLKEMVKIIGATPVNEKNDNRHNKKGFPYLIVGKADKIISVVDEFGKIIKITVDKIRVKRTGFSGTIYLDGDTETMEVKFGRVTVNTGDGSAETIATEPFDTPFKHNCASIVFTQMTNDPVDYIMGSATATDLTIKVNGGLGSEVFNYIAIGY